MNIVRLLRYLVAAPFLMYGLAVNIYLTIHFICRDCLVLVAQANHIAHFITLINVVMVVLGGQVMPRRWLLLVMLPGAVMFGVWYGPGFLPKSEPNVQGIEISVATYNVLGDHTDPARITAVVDALNADVIAFQEVRPHLLDTLAADLHEEYPYQLSLDVRLTIISRYPILDSQTPSGKRFLRAVLDVEGRRVVLYDFHAAFPYFNIRRSYNDDDLGTSIQEMVTQIQQEVDPVIVLCDCNSTPRSIQYAWMDAVLNDMYRARGWGFGLTFPANGDLAPFPIIRIDYIWYSDHFSALDAKVSDESGGSDHLPLWGRLALRES